MFYLMLLIPVLENKISICSRMKEAHKVFHYQDFDLEKKIKNLIHFFKRK